MPGLRELKERINSVKSARKITTAMQMVASSKLKKAAKAAENFVPYQEMLRSILNDFLAYEKESESPYVQKRKVRHVTLVAFSSNSGFCGSFNNIVINALKREVAGWRAKDVQRISLITVGKKVTQVAAKMKDKYPYEEWNRLVEHPSYDGAKELAEHLMELYKKKKTDKVVLIYFHYVNPMVHELRIRDYLPLDYSEMQKNSKKSYLHLYILEPHYQDLLHELLPKVLRTRIYSTLLDSFSSEQAARTLAMQLASDNAKNLLDQLSVESNKLRQQTVTAEILELSAAAEADNF
ncbi:MAG: ATP synthase F1 subunit gamma [Bacteroidales bacterium]